MVLSQCLPGEVVFGGHLVNLKQYAISFVLFVDSMPVFKTVFDTEEHDRNCSQLKKCADF